MLFWFQIIMIIFFPPWILGFHGQRLTVFSCCFFTFELQRLDIEPFLVLNDLI